MATKKKVEENKEVPSIKSAASSALKNKGGFDREYIDKFKKSKNLSTNIGFKKQSWIPLSDAFNNAIGLPGLPEGQIILLRGLSDTGKTTALCEAAVSAQKMGKLVVFIINELKFSFDHLKSFGFETEEEVDEETGEIQHVGNFIFADRLMLPSIESVGSFILDLLNEQEKGKLKYDLVFLVDSFGSLPSEMSIANGKNDGRWNAAAMSLTFASFVNFKFPASRKINSKYTNTMIAINKQGILLPSSPMEKPKRSSKGGSSLYFDAGIVVDFGNITNSGVSKIEAVRNGKTITFAKRTKVAVDKNHVTNSTSSGKLIMTDYGFIEDTPGALNKYKELHRDEWLTVLGEDDFDIIEEKEVAEDAYISYSDVETDD